MGGENRREIVPRALSLPHPPILGRVEWRQKKEREGRVETIGVHPVRSLTIDCCTR